MYDILRKGDIGKAVSDLQSDLRRAGYTVERTAIYDDATRDAVAALQAAAGLVVDGVYGPKSRAALANLDTSRLMRESDLIAAAKRLGVPLASVKAVNEVESRGRGFLPDGRPIILFERHVFWRQLAAHDIDPAGYEGRSSILSRQRGGYAGGAAEYVRLAAAMQIHAAAAQEAASWGAFQIMGYHWKTLGFADIESFVSSQHRSEGDQLSTFTAFVLADPALHRALKARKWAQFARLYNGPAYAENLYDIKLARAYARFVGEVQEVEA
ncbi:N-acetylmuramidase domain-containing protein [Bordetella avium]|uniref:N-acetylmuramidase domain-containing protein n=1 Tax=Bordetella avium TaxID=521 RepID=UPI000FD77141|nr:N-acetylmuramidase domain-containing protein [Bordetella avium]AZY53259.1 peptidoglycan-binding protein [Bordetella avium]